nr:hypothetical protein [Rhizobium mesoamericanum]
MQDYDRGRIPSHTTLSNGRFLRMTGTITVKLQTNYDGRPQRTRPLALEAVTCLFQRRDASAVERLCVVD